MLKLKHKNVLAIGLYGLAIGLFILTLPKQESALEDGTGVVMPSYQHTKAQPVYQDMLKWHLFGLNASVTVKAFSQNNIKLIGVIYKGKSSRDSQAILNINNREQIYQTGQEIQGVGKINTVEENRVLISTKDGLEALELFK